LQSQSPRFSSVPLTVRAPRSALVNPSVRRQPAQVLYRQIPQKQDRHGRPVFIHHGGEAFSDQQREIYAIEGELNRRYQAGDKDAELKRAMPGSQHP
jgi:hypothetical protein